MLRFGIEKLRNFQTLCTTAAGRRGVTTVFPPLINGASTTVTCQAVGTPISDIQGMRAGDTGDRLDTDHALMAGLVGKPWWPRDVTDRIKIGRAHV